MVSSSWAALSATVGGEEEAHLSRTCQRTISGHFERVAKRRTFGEAWQVTDGWATPFLQRTEFYRFGRFIAPGMIHNPDRYEFIARQSDLHRSADLARTAGDPEEQF